MGGYALASENAARFCEWHDGRCCLHRRATNNSVALLGVALPERAGFSTGLCTCTYGKAHQELFDGGGIDRNGLCGAVTRHELHREL